MYVHRDIVTRKYDQFIFNHSNGEDDQIIDAGNMINRLSRRREFPITVSNYQIKIADSDSNITRDNESRIVHYRASSRIDLGIGIDVRAEQSSKTASPIRVIFEPGSHGNAN
jgi:hypothetical protein